MPSKGCGTCKDRRILCDRNIPTCENCSRSKRPCQGYGLRLSWPKQNDGRRSALGPVPSNGAIVRRWAGIQLVNASPRDIEMHYYLSLSNLRKPGSRDQRQPAKLIIPTPVSWAPFNLKPNEVDLLQYFDGVAFSSLATFNQDPAGIRSLLIRLALWGNMSSTTALIHAMLAVSSLHRHGLQSQAVQLKIRALRSLGASIGNNLDPREAAQHIATGLLLCSFEVQQASETSRQWLWYICGAKDMVLHNHLDSGVLDGDFTALLGWLYYHDVLVRFSLRHWRQGPMEDIYAEDLGADRWLTKSCKKQFRWENPQAYSHEILQLLLEVCDIVLSPSDARCRTRQYQDQLRDLEWKVTAIPIPGISKETSRDDIPPELVELYKLATLTYLERASRGSLGPPGRVDRLADRAFSIFSQLDACAMLFPLFVLGCEARTDARRMTVLKLLSRAENLKSNRNVGNIKGMIASVWVQDDLQADLQADADREVDYIRKLNTVLSSSDVLPAFM